MAELNLEPGEYAITTIADVAVNRGPSTSDLVLTNRHLLVVSKTVFGRVKSVKSYQVDQIPVANGQAQIKIDKNAGYKEFFIQLKNGDQLRVVSAQNEDFTSFGSQINLLLTGAATAPSVTNSSPIGVITDSLQSAFAAFGSIANVSDKANIETTRQHKRTNQAPQSVSRQCVGCHAPITGYSGQAVTCKYCDTEQSL